VKWYISASTLAAAALDGCFEHPVLALDITWASAPLMLLRNRSLFINLLLGFLTSLFRDSFDRIGREDDSPCVSKRFWIAGNGSPFDIARAGLS
jgi:hypothetical protein